MPVRRGSDGGASCVVWGHEAFFSTVVLYRIGWQCSMWLWRSGMKMSSKKCTPGRVRYCVVCTSGVRGRACLEFVDITVVVFDETSRREDDEMLMRSGGRICFLCRDLYGRQWIVVLWGKNRVRKCWSSKLDDKPIRQNCSRSAPHACVVSALQHHGTIPSSCWSAPSRRSPSNSFFLRRGSYQQSAILLRRRGLWRRRQPREDDVLRDPSLGT